MLVIADYIIWKQPLILIIIFFIIADFTLINNPVHIITKNKTLSPSAFIPFCEFGGNMTSVGFRTEEFGVPVCNCFQAKNLNDQLCYEVDLNRFSNQDNFDKELELGFNFLMDYNEDRQVTFDEEMEIEKFDLSGNVVNSNQMKDATVYLNTIGSLRNILFKINNNFVFYRTSKTHW